jgi:hypothetical protein
VISITLLRTVYYCFDYNYSKLLLLLLSLKSKWRHFKTRLVIDVYNIKKVFLFNGRNSYICHKIKWTCRGK